MVTFQENNHLAVVDLVSGRTISQFSAGTVQLECVDTVEEDLINLDSSIIKRREPDGAVWIDNDCFAIANEGDYEDENGEEGGSRGFTIFSQNGTVDMNPTNRLNTGLFLPDTTRLKQHGHQLF